MLDCFFPPVDGLRPVFGDSVPVSVGASEFVLRVYVSLLGRFPEPVRGMVFVFGDSASVPVGESELVLRLWAPLFRRSPESVRGLFWVFLDSLSFVVGESSFVLLLWVGRLAGSDGQCDQEECGRGSVHVGVLAGCEKRF